MAFIVGLTGGIASGKSTVSKLLEKRGFAIVDADIAARKVVEPGERAYMDIVEAFGSRVLLEDGTLNRAKLGSIVFQNEEERKKLNAIVHPAVRKKMKDWQEEAIESGKQTVILDIPLLYESKLTHLVEKTIVVFVNEETQLKRLMERNAFTEKEAKSRIASQMPLREKVELADAVIDNNGSIEETETQLDQLIEKWKMKP
ncbi:dephospho-CoA kinase [Siminovitchia fortis]|uniref:Dephospho-CoA kinase n=1 Tax=Siminovitchia fortis TaxID=254758 RepID=A0A443ILC9_9BACI|nr:dephospho-CoA kinase [Siminovitchia fortis]RWR05974.1 dephospho-CoA kinase [Siminovitchia fortis]WHY82368.1 dephospho-CoA kinase [Siminovitchia fortis]